MLRAWRPSPPGRTSVRSGEASVGSEEASVGSCGGVEPIRVARAGERRIGLHHLQLHLPEGEAQVRVRQQRPRQQLRLAQHLEPIADAKHDPAVSRKSDHRLHHRREARDRTGPQVVAIGEAAGHHDRIGDLSGRARRATTARRRPRAAPRAARPPHRNCRETEERRTSSPGPRQGHPNSGPGSRARRHSPARTIS